MGLIASILALDDAELNARWGTLQSRLKERFGEETGIETTLFLIGIQSSGNGFQPRLSKKAKEKVIMEGTHCAFETLGLYKRVGNHSNGHGIWEKTGPSIPKLGLPEQEKLLRVAILKYFDKEWPQDASSG